MAADIDDGGTLKIYSADQPSDPDAPLTTIPLVNDEPLGRWDYENDGSVFWNDVSEAMAGDPQRNEPGDWTEIADDGSVTWVRRHG